MHSPNSNRALLRSLVASAVVLAGATACSRSDRSESGSDNNAAFQADTLSPGSGLSSETTPPSGATGTTAATDTTSATSRRAAGDTAPARIQSNAMEQDTAAVPGVRTDSARVTEDTSETSVNTADTTTSVETAAAPADADTVVAGYVEMARDTSTTVDQTDTAAIGIGAETADEQAVPAEEQELTEDRETVAAAERPTTDEVGAAAVTGTITGTEAVALTSRQGIRCAMVDPELNTEVRWDMASTPVTVNPCGMGSMNLSKVGTEGSGRQK